MRANKVIALVGLVLVLSGPAWASFTVGGQFVPDGPVQMKFNNWDDGTQYGVTSGSYSGVGTLNGLPQIGPASTGSSFPAVAAQDSWGVFQLTDIESLDGLSQYYTSKGATQFITGVFWGEQDDSLSISGTTQTILGNGVQIAFFLTSAPLTTADVANPVTAWNVATAGTLIWTFNSVAGYIAGSSEQYSSQFTPSGTGTFASGSGGFWMDKGTNDAGTGAWNNLILAASGGPADATATFTASGNPAIAGGFLLHSDDPVNTSVVPEPVTMFSAFMAISGLGMYVRRRMAAPAK